MGSLGTYTQVIPMPGLHKNLESYTLFGKLYIIVESYTLFWKAIHYCGKLYVILESYTLF